MAKIELRDGWREVPDHVADLLAGHVEQVYRLTYDEAIELANRELTRRHANAAADKLIREHFTTYGR